MTRSKLVLLLMICCIVALFSFLITQKIQKPRILILHSYATDFSWNNSMDTGINSVLQNNPDVTLSWYYMDTKNHYSPEFLKKAGIAAREVIDTWQPNVIIALDDNAQRLAAKYYVDNPKINIVFAGINASLKLYGYDKAKNVTGILENLPYDALKEVLITMFKKHNLRIWHISDASETSFYVHDEVLSQNWKPFTLVASTPCKTFEDWKKALADAAKNKVDFIIVTHYQTVTENGKNMPSKKLISWTEANSKVPLIGLFGFFVEDGGAMSVAISGIEQGRWAALMATDIIDNHTPPNKIPIKHNKLFSMYFRGTEFKKQFKNIKIPLTYEAMAREMNQFFD